jgi:amino acid transporter
VAGGIGMRENNRPPRVVGPLGATLMSINGMIGAGIFALPALLYAEVGNFAPWMFLVFGLLFSASIFISARLSQMFHASGGPQLWCQVAFGPFVGFQVGWVLVLAMAAGRAATLYVLVSYLAVIFPVFDEALARGCALAFLLAALTGINLSGMKNSVGGLVIGTILKVSPILLLCGFALATGGIATEFAMPRFGAFESVALLVYFAFSGANSSAYAAGELKNPRRDLPLTMLASLGVIIVFYMAVQWAYIASGAPQVEGNATPLASAAAAVMGESGVLLLSLAAIFSIATNALSYFIVGPRVVFAMADRGLLPATFAHVSSKLQTPDRAIVLFAAIVALMLSSGAFTFLATVTSLGAQLVWLVVVAAFAVLMKSPDDRRDGHLAAYWWPIMAVSAGFGLFTIMQAPPSAFALLAGLLVAGTGLYFVARRTTVNAPEPELD